MELRAIVTASLGIAVLTIISVFAIADESKPPTLYSITEASTNNDGECLMATLTVTRQILPNSPGVSTGISYLVRDPCKRETIAQGTGNVPNEAFQGDPRKGGDMSLSIDVQNAPFFQVAVGTPLVANLKWNTDAGKVSSSKTEDSEDTKGKDTIATVKSETKESRQTAVVSGELNIFTPKNGLLMWRDTAAEETISKIPHNVP